MAETLEDLSTMVEDLNRVRLDSVDSQQMGLKVIMNKIKIMSDVHAVPTSLKVGNITTYFTNLSCRKLCLLGTNKSAS